MSIYIISTLIIGLIFGSFFNVVIYRVPLFLEAKLKREKNYSLVKYLSWPASFCPNCKKKIAWFDNIPIFSWILLNGKCRNCKEPIKTRYAVVELLSALIFSYSYFKFGFSFDTIFWIGLFSILVILFFIDAETFFLPDFFTIPLILLCFIGSYLGITNVILIDSVIGAISGFLVLFLVNFFYKAFRKVDGFGGGDFKLLAGLGAWFGWLSLPIIIGMSSIFGLLYVLIMTLIKQKKVQLNTVLPFGPFLILSSLFVYVNSYIFKFF